MQPTGILRFVGEADKGDISISSTNKSRYTTTKAANNKIASVDIQQTHTIALDLMEFLPENLALALLGTVAPITQSGNAITGEQVATAASAGSIYKLRYRNISALTLKVGASVLDENDYEIEDARLGLVRILPGVSIGAGGLTADYTSETQIFQRIAAGQNTAIYGRLVFVEDPTSGPAKDVEIWKVKFMSGGVLSLLSDDFNKMSLSGEVLDDSANHPAAPLYQVTFRDLEGAPGPQTSITFADESDGHSYALQIVAGELEIQLAEDDAEAVSNLVLADSNNGSFYAITIVDGNLTVTQTSGDGAVPSLTLTDQTDGQLYSITSVNGNLTVTQIS
jgi:hypothetical protein